MLKNKETDYFVSPCGEIYSIKSGKLKILSKTKNANGYLKVRICVNGKAYNRNIHRMVAETFIPNPYNKKEVNHIDGNKENNSVNNLEWCTRKENAIHAYKNYLFGGKGENFPTSTITNDTCIKICELLSKTSLSKKEISLKMMCSKKIVDDILHRKTWTHISNNYDFSNRVFNTTINEEIADKICKLLQNSDISSKEISEIVRCKVYQVKDIKRGKTWRKISKKI